MVNVGMKVSDAISLVDPSFLESIGSKYDGVEITVSLSGNSFEISTNTETLLLPKEGDSDPIKFEIIPKKSGLRKLWLYFYYKLNHS